LRLPVKRMRKGSHWRSGILLRAFRNIFFVALLVSVASFAHAENITAIDDAKQSITLTKPAQRIITLAPSLTELAFAAGTGDKLVAVSAYSDYPLIAKKLPQVSDASGVSFESLLALKPDLVLAWKSGNRASDLQRIRDFGIPVFAIEIERMNDVPRALRNIGLLAGASIISERAATDFEQRIEALRAANMAKSKVSVFFEISREPLMSVNRDHAISEVIRLCGGENAFAEMVPLVFVTPLEALFSKQPDVIIYTSSDASEKMPSPRYRGLKAANAKRIYRISADPILRTGPRMAEGAANVCATLNQARQSMPK
jgi:iron complex transport system substrate-binding protein